MMTRIFGFLLSIGLVSGLLLTSNPGFAAGEDFWISDGRSTASSRSGYLYNYGDPNLGELRRNLLAVPRKNTHIIQFGDSHTAADLMTGEIRLRLQNRYGDGGIGLVPAAQFAGIRSDVVKIITDNKNWDLLSSRREESALFPLGGYLAIPSFDGTPLSLEHRAGSSGTYDFSLLYYAQQDTRFSTSQTTVPTPLPATSGQWRISRPEKNLVFPIDLYFDSVKSLLLGGVYITRSGESGVIYSSLGINGATFEQLDKWHPSWTSVLGELAPKMLVVAYGTNEAFDARLDLELYRVNFRNRLVMLRNRFPDSVLLVIGPPDSLKPARKGIKAAATRCDRDKPPNLTPVVQIQRQIAKEQRTLYWDWQGAMGGPCSIKRWHAQGLARDDLVHLSATGYRESAFLFYQSLQDMLSR